MRAGGIGNTKRGEREGERPICMELEDMERIIAVEDGIAEDCGRRGIAGGSVLWCV